MAHLLAALWIAVLSCGLYILIEWHINTVASYQSDIQRLQQAKSDLTVAWLNCANEQPQRIWFGHKEYVDIPCKAKASSHRR